MLRHPVRVGWDGGLVRPGVVAVGARDGHEGGDGEERAHLGGILAGRLERMGTIGEGSGERGARGCRRAERRRQILIYSLV